MKKATTVRDIREAVKRCQKMIDVLEPQRMVRCEIVLSETGREGVSYWMWCESEFFARPPKKTTPIGGVAFSLAKAEELWKQGLHALVVEKRGRDVRKVKRKLGARAAASLPLGI